MPRSTSCLFSLLFAAVTVLRPVHADVYDKDNSRFPENTQNVQDQPQPPARSPSKKCSTDIEIINSFGLALDDKPVEPGSFRPRNGTKQYNRHKIPGGGGLNVTVEVWVQEITTISDITSDFQLDIYMSETWLDAGLTFEDLNPCKGNLSLDNEILEKLWTPNLCFINSKSAMLHESPFKNFFIMIYPNGIVWTNYRLKLTGLLFSCPISLIGSLGKI